MQDANVVMRRRRKAIPFLGVVATMLVHIVFLTPVLWEGGMNKSPRQPEAVGSAANAGSAQGAAAEQMILIDLGTVSESLPDVSRPASPVQLAAAPALLQMLGPDSLPLKPLFVDPEGESSTPTEADLIARTQLVGLYEGQIRARIERAWRRPRTPLADRQFNCRVKVEQDARGNVLSVKLQTCEGTQDWFDSMIHAVKAASPLPAPPNRAVFAGTFQMSFHALSYQEGENEEGFAPAYVVDAGNLQTSPGSRALSMQPGMPRSGDVILRGSGNQVEWISAEDQQGGGP